MVRNIEIYDGKYYEVDFEKLKKYICNIFLVALSCILFLLPDKIGDEYMSATQYIRQTCLIVVSYFIVLALIITKVLDKDMKIGFYEITLLVYILFIGLSCVFSEYKYNVLFAQYARGEGALTLIAYIFCFYIIKETFKYNDRVFNLLIILLLFASCVGLLQALNKTGYEFKMYKTLDIWEYMGPSNFDNPNMFASLLSLFLPIYIIKYIHDKDIKMITVLGVIFAALVCTKTMGGYITFLLYFVGIFTYFIITSKDKSMVLKLYMYLTIVFVLVFSILNIVNNNAYINEILNIEETENINDNETNRMFHGRGAIWKLSFDMINDNYIFGVGPDSMGCEIIEKHNELYKSGFAVDKAHSEYLHIGVTTGIPSLLVYLVFVFTIIISLLIKFINIVKTKGVGSKEAIFIVAIAASIVSYLFQASTNISTLCVAPFFWVMLGIAANISNKETQIV